jgi:hypothetical protein
MDHIKNYKDCKEKYEVYKMENFAGLGRGVSTNIGSENLWLKFEAFQILLPQRSQHQATQKRPAKNFIRVQ